MQRECTRQEWVVCCLYLICMYVRTYSVTGWIWEKARELCEECKEQLERPKEAEPTTDPLLKHIVTLSVKSKLLPHKLLSIFTLRSQLGFVFVRKTRSPPDWVRVVSLVHSLAVWDFCSNDPEGTCLSSQAGRDGRTDGWISVHCDSPRIQTQPSMREKRIRSFFFPSTSTGRFVLAALPSYLLILPTMLSHRHDITCVGAHKLLTQWVSFCWPSYAYTTT